MTIMKKNIFLLAVTLLLIGFASCSDEDTKPIIPSDVIDLSADTQDKPGYIVLRWATPDDNTIRYIKVSYYDYLLEQDVVRLASVYADSVLIPDTRKKFGEYEFKVQSYSETGDAGNVQTIKAVSEPAPVQVVFGESKQIALTVDQLSTNAQEKSEGPIANLIDGDASANSYFHSTWNNPIPAAPAKDTYGTVTYTNNGNAVGAFNLRLPVTVTYKWGTVKSYVIIPVEKTLGN